MELRGRKVGERDKATQRERERERQVRGGDGPRRLDWMWMSDRRPIEEAVLRPCPSHWQTDNGTHTERATVPREVTLLQEALGLI